MKVEEVIKSAKPLSEQSRTIIHLILVGNKIHETLAHELKPFDVSPEQFNVLRILRGREGIPANLSTLNERMVTKMSNTTRLVDKLIKKGYVDRRICPSNRRKVEITLTDHGLDGLKEMDLAVNRAQTQILIGLSHDDIVTLNDLIDKI